MVNEPWRAVVAGVFQQILFANKATEMAYLVFAGARATESKVNTSYSNAAVLIVIRIT